MSGAANPWDDDRISAYVDGVLDPVEHRQFEEELAARPELLEAVNELRAMRERLRSLPKHQLPEDFGERVLQTAEQRMLLGSDTRTKPSKASPALPRRLPWLFVPLAAAAAILLVTLLRPRDSERRVAQGPPTPAQVDSERLNAAVPPFTPAGESDAANSPTDAGSTVELIRAGETVDDFEKKDAEMQEALALEPNTNELPFRCGRAVVATPRTMSQRESLYFYLSATETAAEDSAAPAIDRARDAELAGGRRREFLAGGEASPAVAENTRHGTDIPNPTAPRHYDVYLVSALSREPLDRFLEQLHAEQIDVQEIPVAASAESRLRDIIPQVPPSTPMGGDIERSDNRLGQSAQRLAKDEKSSLTVTALGRMQTPSISVEEAVSQLEVRKKQSSETSTLGGGQGQLVLDELEAVKPSTTPPCSMLLIVETDPIED